MKLVATLVVCLCLLAGLAQAQTASAPQSEKEKMSYSLGYDLGNNTRRQGVELDPDLVAQGLKDGMTNSVSKLTEQQMRDSLMALRREARLKAAEKLKVQGEANQKEGEAFLAENKKKEGVKTTASGLQYKVLTEGKGKQPTLDDTVEVNYRGTLINGTEFDSSYKRNKTATIPLKGVIKGWQEALPMMKEGSKWQLFIPSELAYGANAPPQIGPNSTLIFEIELITVKAKEAKPAAEAPAKQTPAKRSPNK